ncbi:ATP-grasp fold amidoligase family protein [Pontibacter liquoris]|uniref:ATP-grasp fold amidoligase family protein n=1 Tax=Pontibacter liquoris TaxID=2905677 RepID=UPI001FA7059A|nr:ATP-grasp fold amidoligase family protein [Pontibacter liquoris]
MRAYDPLEKWQDVAHWQRKLSNKYNAREFASKHGCRVPALFWRGREVNMIDFDALPPQYVIRPTIGHSSQKVFLMDGAVNLMDNRSYTPDHLKKALSGAIAENPYLEFLLEEFVKDENGAHRIPDDYKISVFNGEVAFIDVINRTSPKTGFSSCYTQHWERIENVADFYQPAPLQNLPRCLGEMLVCARQLSKAYKIFVRIDFYATDKGAVFGEFTPTPSQGDGFTAKADKLLTRYWDTYCYGMI